MTNAGLLKATSGARRADAWTERAGCSAYREAAREEEASLDQPKERRFLVGVRRKRAA
jgi:hypothetical protein